MRRDIISFTVTATALAGLLAAGIGVAAANPAPTSTSAPPVVQEHSQEGAARVVALKVKVGLIGRIVVQVELGPNVT